MQTLQDRFRRVGPAGALPIVEGGREDYLALKAHHYRAGHPATMLRVLVIREAQANAGDRFLSRPPTRRPIAVLVESMPVLSCTLREYALHERYAGLAPRQRSRLLNEELRCISRVIVDPRWRGLGLAVALVRHALATATTRYTEAMAVMGRVSPFFGQAGMTAYQRPPLEVDERAIAALNHMGIDPGLLALPSAMQERLDQLDASHQSFLKQELMRWYRTAGGRGASSDALLSDVLQAARQRLLARPIYYLHENKHVHY